MSGVSMPIGHPMHGRRADASPTCFDVWVFEFELQSWRDVRLRVGRWHFRTWPSFFMLLPRGYKPSVTVWAVQIDVDDVDGARTVQLGAFTDERAAQSCLEALEQEGWSGLYLTMISVHARLEDWRWDRQRLETRAVVLWPE